MCGVEWKCAKRWLIRSSVVPSHGIEPWILSCHSYTSDTHYPDRLLAGSDEESLESCLPCAIRAIFHIW
jgi:hypothetical protein